MTQRWISFFGWGLLFLTVSLNHLFSSTGLKLNTVTLSTGGVGYFEYETEVEGNGVLALSIPLTQVDDALKSMVVYDSQGSVGSISLSGREPLTQSFRDFPFDKDAFESPAKLLRHLRGAKISVKGPQRIYGRILNVVPEPIGLGKDTEVIRHRVSVIGKKGLEHFIFEEALSIKFDDANLRKQLNTALATLESHRAKDKRTLEVQISGNTKRPVRIGYVSQAPLWKTSYRLTIGENEGDSRLQGWAILENMSGQNWSTVDLNLISGNPVTFHQALYPSYYVSRPSIPVEVLGRILPPVDEGSVGKLQDQDIKLNRQKKLESALPQEALMQQRAMGFATTAQYADEAIMETADVMAAPTLAAQSQEAGAQVFFQFPKKIDLQTGHSMMLPIIDNTIKGQSIALYQPHTHTSHPLVSFEIANDSNTALPQGVLTIYQSIEGRNRYVGDAQLDTLPVGEKRMLSFALDQSITISKESKSTETLYKGKIARGIFEHKVVQRKTTDYRIKAPAGKARTLIIEHPRRTNWQLVQPSKDSIDVTQEHYRIRQAIEGESIVQVITERPQTRQIGLFNLSSNQLVYYLENTKLSPDLQEVFKKILDYKQEIENYGITIRDLENKREGFFNDQERIRENLRRISKNTDLYNRYLRKLDEQENKIEKIEDQVDAAKAKLNDIQQKLTDFIAELDL